MYTGVTNDLIKRVYEHRTNAVDGFTKNYKIHLLVHYEEANEVNAAIAREKALKKWRRQWKIDLIETHNPDWLDLYETLTVGSPHPRG